MADLADEYVAAMMLDGGGGGGRDENEWPLE